MDPTIFRRAGGTQGEESDWVDELPPGYAASERQLRRRRAALSAEAFGDWNKPPDFHPHPSEKTEEQAAWLRQALEENRLFSVLATREEDLRVAISSFQMREVEAGTVVTRQGDTEDKELYILEAGAMDVFLRPSHEDAPPGQKVASFTAGQFFGELALLHNAPRAATIIARNPCRLWALDRDTFNVVMRINGQRRREIHTEFLRGVKLLEKLDMWEIGQIADAVIEEEYPEGSLVVKAGDMGDCFYIVEEGHAVAQINGVDARGYDRGGYFGELSLINDRPRAADVIARSAKLKVLSLGRDSFQRLLGTTALFKDQEKDTPNPQLPPGGNRERRRSVNFNFSAEDNGPKEPMKRGTGFIDAAKLLELIDAEPDDSDDPVPGGGGVRFADADVGDGERPRYCRRGTGFVRVEALKRFMEQCCEADDMEDAACRKAAVSFAVDYSQEMHVTSEPSKPKLKRAGTGFVRVDKLKELAEQAHQDADEEGAEEACGVGPVESGVRFAAGTDTAEADHKKHRCTGFVHPDQLRKFLQEAEDDQDAPRKLSRLSGAAIYISPVEIEKLALVQDLEDNQGPEEEALALVDIEEDMLQG